METQELLLNYLKNHAHSSSKEIFEGLHSAVSYATVKRSLSKLLSENHIVQQGNAKNSRYTLSPTFNLFYPINLDEYYSKEIDEREILTGYNFSLIPETLQNVPLFTSQELTLLHNLQNKFSENIAQLSDFEYKKDMERLAIDLSWKSSQIEGNTYSLLETERLLKDKQTAEGKTKDEAIMLLNHKDAIDFVVENSDYFLSLSVAKIEEVHSILIKELGVDRNIRTRRVGITGTNYRPLENEFQIREALQQTCDLINNRENIFEKDALLMTGVKSSFLCLRSPRHERSLRFYTGNPPCLGLWAKPGAPYVCVEPWFGLNDSYEYKDDLSKKDAIQSAEAGGSLTFTWSAEIF